MDHKKHQPPASPLSSLFHQWLWKTKTRAQRRASWHLEPFWIVWWFLRQACLSSSDLNPPLLDVDVLTASELKSFRHRDAETFWHIKHFFTSGNISAVNSFSSATVDSLLCYLWAEWAVYADGEKATLVCIKHSTILGLKTPHPKDDCIFTSAWMPLL